MVKYDSSVRFEVVFTCAHGCFNEGDSTTAGLALIAEWYKCGKVAISDELQQYISDNGMGEMFALPAAETETDAEEKPKPKRNARKK